MIADLLDCPDPAELAAFYQAILSGTLNRRDRRWARSDDWATLHTSSGFVLAFQRVPDDRSSALAEGSIDGDAQVAL
ncbi:hypothetical protein GCM10022226_03390 [Sphaerisporangium flaviroseum]|uniref:Glyoxalase-like domain-containing protein n=1 Tax=Sphaerisporangium flaviroseum TaxID=509199 RepID=A0ABP7HG08_9ACTN